MRIKGCHDENDLSLEHLDNALNLTATRKRCKAPRHGDRQSIQHFFPFLLLPCSIVLPLSQKVSTAYHAAQDYLTRIRAINLQDPLPLDVFLNTAFVHWRTRQTAWSRASQFLSSTLKPQSHVQLCLRCK